MALAMFTLICAVISIISCAVAIVYYFKQRALSGYIARQLEYLARLRDEMR